MVAANGDVMDVVCKRCGVVYQIIADREDVLKWLSGEGYIQDILDYLSPAERELLISGTCDSCWKILFPEQLDTDDE